MAACGRARLAAAYVVLLTTSVGGAAIAWGEAASIDSLLVPALVELGKQDSLLLECAYSVSDVTGLSVEWYFKPAAGAGEEAGEQLVYRSTPPLAGEVVGVLRGRTVAEERTAETPMRSRLRVVKPSVQLSGEYTCVVSSSLGGGEARRTRSMLVYSGEHDMRLEARQRGDTVEVSCSVNSVYPEPDLTIERLNSSIAQESRVRRAERDGDGGEGLLDAAASARLQLAELRATETFVCRLRLMQTPYSAVRELKFQPRFNEHKPPMPTTVKTTTTTEKPDKGGAGEMRAGAAGAAAVALLLIALAY